MRKKGRSSPAVTENNRVYENKFRIFDVKTVDKEYPRFFLFVSLSQVL